jgi:hypothetical protein
MREQEVDHKLVETLRTMEERGASLIEMLNVVHDWYGVPKYTRGILLGPFHAAFGMKPLDFTTLLFTCEIFGDGASVNIEDTERGFRERVAEIRNRS